MRVVGRLPLLLLPWLLIFGSAGCQSFGWPGGEWAGEFLLGNERASERMHRRGVRLANHGKLEKAEKAFLNAVKADESFGPAHNNLGLLHYEKGDLYAAAWSFERAMSLLPERAEPINNMGMTLEAAGRFHEAIELYEAAWSLEPANSEYLGNLIRARLRRGDSDFTVQQELAELILIETRPDWREFAQQRLTMLSRETAAGLEELETPAESISPPANLPPPTPRMPGLGRSDH